MELFDEYTTLRAVIDCALEGRLGSLTVDESGGRRVARIDLGCYVAFSGDPDHPRATEWLESLAGPLEVLIPSSGRWRDRLLDRLGQRTVDRTMATFDPGPIETARLAEIATVDGFRVEPLTLAAAGSLDETHAPHALQVFPDAAAFVEHGFGFAAFSPDGRVAAQASSYTVSSRAVEICISTHADFRRRGLARVVAARMIHECLDRGLRPEWSAANPVSQHLARSLGYAPSAPCEIRFLEE